MHWNYRLIDMSHNNAGEPWLELHEVFYEDDGSLMGYTPVSTGGESVESLKQTLEWMMQATKEPVLRVTDFKGEMQ